MQIKFKKNLIHERLGDKIILLYPDSGKFYELNDSATFIFERIINGMGKKDILRSLTNQFECDETEAAKDFDKFILNIKEAGFVAE